MKKVVVSLLAAIAVLMGGAGAAHAAPVKGKIQFNYIRFDSPGKDSGSNASLNAEYVRIVNGTKASVNTTGWLLSDKSAHLLLLPNRTIKPGGQIWVKSGKGTNTGSTIFWQKSWYVWNNGGDSATLLNKYGKLLDSCGWTKLGSGHTSC